MQRLLKKGLQAEGTDWPTLARVYGWVYQLAQVLDDDRQMAVEERQLGFQLILLHMHDSASQLGGMWEQAIAHFLKVSQSYAPHLFFCYQVADLPRTNNALEQAFGQVRCHERRATGRKGALPGLVVHGAVRVQAALATRVQVFTAQQLAPSDLQAWRDTRAQVSFRQESRCKQARFRRDPVAYLANLEAKLIKDSLRS